MQLLEATLYLIKHENVHDTLSEKSQHEILLQYDLVLWKMCRRR